MARIEMNGRDFERIIRACSKVCDRSNFRKTLQYIELRADGEYCVATALDGFVMNQIKVICDGEGVVKIPGTIRPPKHEICVIEESTNLRITYLDSGGNLIYTYEVPKYDAVFFNWGNIVKDAREEDIIHCNAGLLRKALEATKCADDQTICISIPRKKDENIRIASNDVQMIVLPLKINDESNARRFENWYKPHAQEEKHDA